MVVRKNNKSKRPERGKTPSKPSGEREGPKAGPPPDAVVTSAVESSPPKLGFPIVGVGASAGGLEAFTELLTNLPQDTGMAFVLVQHLDPKHDSMLTEILARSTRMPVIQVTHGLGLRANHVYVIPPGATMSMVDGSFQLVPRPGPQRGRDMLIDYFFRSLADQLKSRAIGIILSGALSDGALGLRAIKAEGGMTFAQEESTAKFHDMPRAAVSSGAVDFVLPPKKIAEELARLARHPYVGVIAAPEREILGEALPDQAKIFQMLRSATGVDFSNYRQTTIRRRISRRMALNKIDRLSEYINFLRQNGSEVQKLYDDLLINVTGFFRDPETFQSLKSIVFPSLLKNRAADSPVRVWVPGCSTGEEVYSIAIALFECLGETGGNPPIQIFATDISEPAIERARTGIYLENAIADLSPERLRRFFVSVESGYQISKSIRDVCVFARQNVVADPPFSNLDVLSCRNVLIYLEPVLQKRVIPLFYYALKPTGYLVLGSAETLAATDLFAAIDKNVRVFTKRPGAIRPIIDFTALSATDMDGDRPVPPPTEHNRFLELQKEADRIVMSNYGPPGVIVNEGLDVVQFRGRTSRFLEAPSGTPSLNVLKMAREGLLVELRDSIAAARKTGTRVVKESVRVRTNKEFHSIRLEVDPIRQEKGG
ncbi:MAG TPA: chemotaxis protein CheB, partial [Thermoanaerobaculia bacterium]|nr:chemotaxis protein CheB [Thermoanaerobaculia bacterium]